VGGVGVPLGINRAGKSPDAAAKFIDYATASPDAALPRIAIGALPATTPLRAPAGSAEVLRDVITAWNAATKDNKIGWYLDFATPTFYDTLTGALQELLALRITPDAFVKRLQADYGKHVKP
jgi:raffinose/stachyose/melibiose transport system substrate-binding protein